MRSLTVLSVCITLALIGCAEISTIIPSTSMKQGALTNEEIIRGLKEALNVGASNSVITASALDGFYGNPQLFIPFPPEVIKMKDTLEKAGFTNLVTDFEKSLNHAAEEASKKALPILKNAITYITFTDAMGILHGPNDAATIYLKSKAESNLRSEFKPVVRNAIQTVEVTSYWNPIATVYNNMVALTGGTKVNPNLEEYITQKTLDGLFLLIAQEEQEIRQNPTARITDILKKVFAGK